MFQGWSTEIVPKMDHSPTRSYYTTPHTLSLAIIHQVPILQRVSQEKISSTCLMYNAQEFVLFMGHLRPSIEKQMETAGPLYFIAPIATLAFLVVFPFFSGNPFPSFFRARFHPNVEADTQMDLW